MIGRVALLCMLLFATGAQAQTVLHSFCSQPSCADGRNPQFGLIADAAGNLFGTTTDGGASDRGVVFELSPDGGGGWTYSVIHTFCPQGSPCKDGSDPAGPLIVDGAGNLYGTTTGGGKQNGGIAFELMPQGGGQWDLVVMHGFCKQANCVDGNIPGGGLAYLGQRNGAAYDGESPLYGTTTYGGTFNQGLVYALTPPPPGGRSWWTPKALYSFCPEGGFCPADGRYPASGVVVDSRRVLYGTTLFGGPQDAGTAFKLTRPSGSWEHQVVYDFCSLARCADGRNPSALTESGAGELLGGTLFGPHVPGCIKKTCGTVFDLAPQTGTLTTLHTFCSETDCADGRGPGPVTILSNGDLLGAAQAGGDSSNVADGGGVLFRLDGSATLSVLHDFCVSENCTDGRAPVGKVVVDGSGRMFGVTSLGGDAGGGTIFEVDP